jgi:hypothetical protein
MTNAFTVVLSIVFLVSSCVIPKKFSFTETHNHSATKKLTKILIAGVGSSPDRIFLENLGKNLIQELKSKAIASEFQYLGSTNKIAKENFKTLKKESYEAVLIFTPETPPIFEINTYDRIDYLNTSPVILPSRIQYSETTYEQDFFIKFYSFENNTQLIWDSKLSLDFNLTSPNIYKSIVSKIIKIFSSNHYIE